MFALGLMPRLSSALLSHGPGVLVLLVLTAPAAAQHERGEGRWRQARERRLARLGYSRVEVRHGDGYAGWPDEAPFDAILVTAAADSIPPALLDQLASGGRLVMPVGDQVSQQMMVLVQKDATGRLVSRQLFPVRFVPLLRGIR